MNLGSAYQELLDALTFVAGFAPNFPPLLRITTEEAIQRAFNKFSTIQELEKNGSALIWLNLCQAEMRAGRDAYLLKGDLDGGAKHLNEAQRYAENALRRKSHTPDFIAGPQGEIRKNPLKGPEQADSN